MGRHMHAIGQQRHGVKEQAADNLHHHEQGGDQRRQLGPAFRTAVTGAKEDMAARPFAMIMRGPIMGVTVIVMMSMCVCVVAHATIIGQIWLEVDFFPYPASPIRLAKRGFSKVVRQGSIRYTEFFLPFWRKLERARAFKYFGGIPIMITPGSPFDAINDGKANFEAIYNRPDPRDYFRVLGGLGYAIPDLAKTVIRSLILAVGKYADERPLKVLDIGCSYGINAALQKYPIDLQRLAYRYTAKEMQDVDCAALGPLDSHYFRSWPLKTDAIFVGLDTSQRALNYAMRAGLLEAAVWRNLENENPTTEEAAVLRGANLIISTGCVGYVTEKTLRRLLMLQKWNAMPWVANFVLRMFPYDAISESLEHFGLVTEKLEGVTFIQRRFHSEAEFETTLNRLKDRGINPEGKEADGLLHAELYVSRPAEVVQTMPLNEIVSVTSGASRDYGRRFAPFSRKPRPS
jgi:hypothetical protein